MEENSLHWVTTDKSTIVEHINLFTYQVKLILHTCNYMSLHFIYITSLMEGHSLQRDITDKTTIVEQWIHAPLPC